MTSERVFRLAQWTPRWDAVWYLLWAAFLFAFTSYETHDLWILVRGLIWIGFVSFLIARLFASARQRESEEAKRLREAAMDLAVATFIGALLVSSVWSWF